MNLNLPIPKRDFGRFDFKRSSKELSSRGRKAPAPVTRAAATPAQKAIIRRCRDDICFWVNEYGFTYDPRLLPANPIIPFRLYPKQEEFLGWLAERERLQEDGLAEKSRDVGFTWLCCADALHGWLFRPGFTAGFGSRKLELVDRLGDPDSIFEKIRILLRALPAWMLPAGFKWTEHDNHARLLNPETGATLTGEGGDEIGRGGRKTKYFVDEAAFLEHADRVERALSQTTRCRIWVSTPNGPGNAFARKRHSGRIAVFTFHWKDDPRKNRYAVYDAAGEVVAEGQGQAPPVPEGGRVVYPWYAAECARLGDSVAVAQEIDIDYSASVAGICIPARWVRAAVNLPLPGPPSGAAEAGLDIAEMGEDANVFQPRRGPLVLPPTAWGQTNTTQTTYRAADLAEAAVVTVLHYDCVGVGAGVRGTADSSERRFSFRWEALNGGASPSERVWPDGKTSKERFLNLRAELAWQLRTRFEKAYEYRLWLDGDPEGREHPAEELISIPDHPGLIADLSLPLVQTTDTGKTKLEGKDAMRRRGVKSPNYFDALCYSFAPCKPVSGPPTAGGQRPLAAAYRRQVGPYTGLR